LDESGLSEKLVAGDETWVFQNDPQTNESLMESHGEQKEAEVSNSNLTITLFCLFHNR
jgi:hypothetical protein